MATFKIGPHSGPYFADKDMTMHYRVVASFSTAPQMLAEAEFLIGLAEAHPVGVDFHQTTLAASAALILAVTLDQGTLNVLDHAAKVAQATDARRQAADIQDLLSESLRRRVIRLPEVLTNSKFQLDGTSRQVRALHDLITLRNDLMHVNEEADNLDCTIDEGLLRFSPPEVIANRAHDALCDCVQAALA